MRILVLAALLLPSLAWAQFLSSPAFNVPTFANPAQTRTNLGLGSTGGAVAGTLLAPVPCGGDDYPALSALVTTAAVAGATVQLQPGTYSLNTGLVLGNNVYLTGAGESATFLKPGAAVASLVTMSGSNSGLANLTLQNLSARATNGLTINKAVNDLPLNVSHVQFILLPLGVQVLAGDNIRISDSFFNTNATNISLQCSGDNILNAWIERNFMLGGNGIDLPVPVTAGKHVEGLNVTENIVLPAMTGTFGMRVTAGLEAAKVPWVHYLGSRPRSFGEHRLP